MNKKIEDLSELELKAIGYDSLLIIEQHQQNIMLIKQELIKRSQEPTKEDK